MTYIDLPKICIRDLFPGKEPVEADRKMIEAAQLIEDWFKRETNFPYYVSWLNQISGDNPNGNIGHFRIYKDK
jgi:hypothetical protein